MEQLNEHFLRTLQSFGFAAPRMNYRISVIHSLDPRQVAQSIGLSQPDISCGKPVKCKIQPMPRPLCVEEPLPPALIDAAMTHAEPIKAMLTAFSAQCI